MSNLLNGLEERMKNPLVEAHVEMQEVLEEDAAFEELGDPYLSDRSRKGNLDARGAGADDDEPELDDEDIAFILNGKDEDGDGEDDDLEEDDEDLELDALLTEEEEAQESSLSAIIAEIDQGMSVLESLLEEVAEAGDVEDEADLGDEEEVEVGDEEEASESEEVDPSDIDKAVDNIVSDLDKT